MSIEVIEVIDSSHGHDHLLAREEHWMLIHRSSSKEAGFNISLKPSRGCLGVKRTKAQSRRNAMSIQSYIRDPKNRVKIQEARVKAIANGFGGPKTYVLYDPAGKRVEITNLKGFCDRQRLEYGPMHAMAIGRSIQYRGWKTSPDRKDKANKPFRVESPSGRIYEGVGLRAFCKRHKLSERSMYGLVSGHVKTAHGWRLPGKPASYYRQRSGNRYVLVSPSGKEITVTNLNEWCRKRPKISYESLVTGHVSRTGWRLKEKLGHV